MIYSMTAFAQVSEQGEWGLATWELRAVNSRYFDCIIKLPEPWRYLEPEIRRKLQQRVTRGRIEALLLFQPGEKGRSNLKLNRGVVRQLGALITKIKEDIPLVTTVDPLALLSWPQVLYTTEASPVITAALWQLLERASAELVATRAREGAVLAEVIHSKGEQVLAIVNNIKYRVPSLLANQQERVLARLAELKGELDQVRLEQELVFLAQRTDVTEELERLAAHGKEVLRLLDEGGTVGKRLDFLMQELNREANTLAAKAVTLEVTQAAITLKVLIEQMREQTQNIV